MVKVTGPTDPNVRLLITRLRKVSNEHNAKIWRTVYEILRKPRRNRPAVNVSRINRYTKDGQVVLVPGKVLGAGVISHPVTVVALSFSGNAKDKVESAGGKCYTINEYLDMNPKGNNITLMK